MSVVRTSHSLSRFGYCCWELLLRGAPPVPAFTAVPPMDSEHPVNTVTVLTNPTRTTRTARTLLFIVSSFRVRNRLTSQFFCYIARRREWLLTETDRPFDEVVLELDSDFAQRVAQVGLVADGNETAVTVDVDVF